LLESVPAQEMASNLHYHIDDRVSLLEENARGIYDTPGTYSAQWSPPPNHGDLGSPEYEMRTRMGQPVMRNDSETSTPSMGGYFPKQPRTYKIIQVSGPLLIDSKIYRQVNMILSAKSRPVIRPRLRFCTRRAVEGNYDIY
jgi:hypothetical protein